MSSTFLRSPLARAALERNRTKLSGPRALVCRRYWTPEEELSLKKRYANERNHDIAVDMQRTIQQLYAKAKQLGLRKSPEMLRQILAECGNQVSSLNSGQPFKTGHQPWNKGLQGIPVSGRSRETQFKNGEKPKNWLPIGSTRVADGYLQRKITDTGYPPADWQPVHVLLWVQNNGPVPENHCVCFVDGDRSRIELENLELITRAERMLRNTIHRYPDQLKSAIRAVGRLKRTIRRVEREEQN